MGYDNLCKNGTATSEDEYYVDAGMVKKVLCIPEEDSVGKHYKFSYAGIKLDPYRILSVYGITCPAQQHAIKKLLRAGNSVKDLRRDLQEVIVTLQRKLEMLDEDERLGN